MDLFQHVEQQRGVCGNSATYVSPKPPNAGIEHRQDLIVALDAPDYPHHVKLAYDTAHPLVRESTMDGT